MCVIFDAIQIFNTFRLPDLTNKKVDNTQLNLNIK